MSKSGLTLKEALDEAEQALRVLDEFKRNEVFKDGLDRLRDVLMELDG